MQRFACHCFITDSSLTHILLSNPFCYTLWYHSFTSHWNWINNYLKNIKFHSVFVVAVNKMTLLIPQFIPIPVYPLSQTICFLSSLPWFSSANLFISFFHQQIIFAHFYLLCLSTMHFYFHDLADFFFLALKQQNQNAVANFLYDSFWTAQKTSFHLTWFKWTWFLFSIPNQKKKTLNWKAKRRQKNCNSQVKRCQKCQTW